MPEFSPSAQLLNISICSPTTSYMKRNCFLLKVLLLFLKKFLADTCPFLGPLVPLFWISGDVSSGFQSQSGCLIRIVEANVMYVPWDPPLVLHLPTSWWLAHSRSCPHILLQRWGCQDSNSCSRRSTNWAKPGPTKVLLLGNTRLRIEICQETLKKHQVQLLDRSNRSGFPYHYGSNASTTTIDWRGQLAIPDMFKGLQGLAGWSTFIPKIALAFDTGKWRHTMFAMATFKRTKKWFIPLLTAIVLWDNGNPCSGEWESLTELRVGERTPNDICFEERSKCWTESQWPFDGIHWFHLRVGQC